MAGQAGNEKMGTGCMEYWITNCHPQRDTQSIGSNDNKVKP